MSTPFYGTGLGPMPPARKTAGLAAIGYDARNLAQSAYTTATGDLGGTSRVFCNTGPIAVNSARALYVNMYVDTNGTGEITNAHPGTLTINATLEYPLNTFYPLTVAGKAVFTLDYLGEVLTDDLEVDIPANTTYWVRTYVQAAGFPQAIPSGVSAYTQSGQFSGNPDTSVSGVNYKQNGGGAGTDQTLTSGGAWITSNFAYAFGPVNVLGSVASKATGNIVAIAGDSIEAGVGDIALDQGFVVRACKTAGLPYHMFASKGEAASNFVGKFTRNRMMMVPNCTAAVCNWGTNDLYAGVSATTIFANLQAAWARLAARGLKVYQTTILPRTNSSDSWTTAGNQTPSNSTFETQRLALNVLLRAATPGTGAYISLSGLFDTAAKIEVDSSNAFSLTGGRTYCGATNSTRMSFDGVHPNAAGHTLVATAVVLSTLPTPS